MALPAGVTDALGEGDGPSRYGTYAQTSSMKSTSPGANVRVSGMPHRRFPEPEGSGPQPMTV